MKYSAFISAAVLAILCCDARALTPDQIALVVNKNLPASRELAEFYAKARLIPDGRIIQLDVPVGDEIAFDLYERDVVPPIRLFLREHQLESKIKCLVTFRGVPIRIGAKRVIITERQELVDVRRALVEAQHQCDLAVIEAEKSAETLDDSFTPANGTSLEALVARAEHAIRALSLLRNLDEAQLNKATEARFKLLEKLTGLAELLSKFDDDQLSHLAPASQPVAWAERRKQFEDARREGLKLQELRNDPEARKKVRESFASHFGLFGYTRILQAQADYLDNDGTTAALDNELAMLWWSYYSRARWVPNPFNYQVQATGPPPVMVMRLDGPNDEIVRRIVLDSLRAEKDGLSGVIALDSTGGTAPGGAVDRAGEYRKFDQKFIALADMLRANTKFTVKLDQRPLVIPPNSIEEPIAIYCGWYNLRAYAPPGKFSPGAVGYHVASLEMVSLRPGERGWVVGLLTGGVTATLGPVNEPYLHAFPPPDEFFPLLLTGKLTLAEVYWKTNPLASWMMSAIGDPLYTPFKDRPALKGDDLPTRLQPILKNLLPEPTTAPAH